MLGRYIPGCLKFIALLRGKLPAVRSGPMQRNQDIMHKIWLERFRQEQNVFLLGPVKFRHKTDIGHHR